MVVLASFPESTNNKSNGNKNIKVYDMIHEEDKITALDDKQDRNRATEQIFVNKLVFKVSL